MLESCRNFRSTVWTEHVAHSQRLHVVYFVYMLPILFLLARILSSRNETRACIVKVCKHNF